MKIQILFSVVVATGALAAYFTEMNPSAPSVAPGDIAVSTLHARRNQPALRAEGSQEASTSVPETAELRALLEHSLVTGGNARAFIPGEAAFHLLATTVDGNISSDFSEKEERHRGPVQKIDTVVGGPSQAVIKIHATNGSIRVAETNP